LGNLRKKGGRMEKRAFENVGSKISSRAMDEGGGGM